MDLIDELMTAERLLASGHGPVYDAVLAEDAIVIVPAQVLGKAECVAAMGESPGWDTAQFTSARLIDSGSTATVVYTFRGTRGDDEYSAILSSSYRMPEKKLFLHQHTPLN